MFKRERELKPKVKYRSKDVWYKIPARELVSRLADWLEWFNNGGRTLDKEFKGRRPRHGHI